MSRNLLLLVSPLIASLFLAGCVVHHHHDYDDRYVVGYDVEEGPPPPPPEPAVVVGAAPYPGAVWIGPRWERDREHRHWVWRRGYWH